MGGGFDLRKHKAFRRRLILVFIGADVAAIIPRKAEVKAALGARFNSSGGMSVASRNLGMNGWLPARRRERGKKRVVLALGIVGRRQQVFAIKNRIGSGQQT